MLGTVEGQRKRRRKVVDEIIKKINTNYNSIRQFQTGVYREGLSLRVATSWTRFGGTM